MRRYDLFDSCRAFITAVSCVYEFPPCEPITGQLNPICPELCPEITFNIEDCAINPNENYPAVNEALDIFVCTEPETYFMGLPPQYIQTDTSECTELCKCCTYVYIYIYM